MPVKRVILHLGMPRAGSTSIQSTLFNNSEVLEKNGYRYLKEWGQNHLSTMHYLFSPFPVRPLDAGRFGRPVRDKKKRNKKAINKMLRVIETTECETLILSGEYFHELYLDQTMENMKSFIEKYFHANNIETTIFYIVRNPLTWIVSYVQQTIMGRGYLNKSDDYFSTRIKQYKGVINLQKHFSDSLLLSKFEDICLDRDGLVGCFLKMIKFPEEELKNLNLIKTHGSKCAEAVEFIYYIEAVEPRFPGENYKRFNLNRSSADLRPLKSIRGTKFDLPYQGKVELWNRFQEAVHLLRENTGIDYTNYQIPPPFTQETYTEKTIQGFIDAFPNLSLVLQKHFLRFFEKKYMETAQEKFKQLHFKDSIPWKEYNCKSTFLSLLNLRVRNKLRKFKNSTT